MKYATLPNRKEKGSSLKEEIMGSDTVLNFNPNSPKIVFNFKYICYFPRNIDLLALVNDMGHQE